MDDTVGTTLSEGVVKTSGGRVLAVTCTTREGLQKAIDKVYRSVNMITFDGAIFRKDIAHRALKEVSGKGISYRDCGVNIDEGDAVVNAIKPLVKSTARPGIHKSNE